MKTIKRLVVFAGIVTLLSVCTARAPDISVDELTEEGYVSLYSSSLKGKYGPVIIFPERHDSRLIQAEFALALYRLSEKSGLARIALEGMFEGETCNTYRFPELETLTEAQRNEMLLGFLENGDIKAPEFMYLAKNSYVFGIEKKDEYDIGISGKAGSAYQNYLLTSILVDKGEEIVSEFEERFDKFKNAVTTEEYVAARKNLFSLNEWTVETEQLIGQGRSSDKVLERLNELAEKCGRFFDQQTQKDFAEYVNFEKTAQRRSLSMAENVLGKLKKENGIIAMVIGAAHTGDIETYFAAKGVQYYVLEPEALNNTYVSDLTYSEYDRKNGQKPVEGNAVLDTFLGVSKNPRSSISTVWIKKDFAVATLLTKISSASASGEQPPYFGFNPAGLNIDGIQVVSAVKRKEDNVIRIQLRNANNEVLWADILQDNLNIGIGGIQNVSDGLINLINALAQADYREHSAAAINNFLSAELQTDLIQAVKLGKDIVLFSSDVSLLDNIPADTHRQIIQMSQSRI